MNKNESNGRFNILSSETHSILLLDDNSDIVSVLKKSLELAGYAVSGFTDAILALEHYRANSSKYSMIISDIRMPNITGVEFAEAIRKFNRLVKIILVSAFDMKELQISDGLGISETIEKPVLPSRLNAIVSKHLATGTEPK
jgi:CheY-like chemotaxis protein